ncbi:MAG TPA: ABC transporter permease [Blastocatellia bacterium]|nr:ABC transporter permease [Blastocatellia bacterium]
MEPKWPHIVRERLAALRLPPEREIEIVEELALHLESLYEDALADGLSPTEAEARAVQSYDWRLLECELSRVERLMDSSWSPAKPATKGGNLMATLFQDFRFGLRMLVKQPGFTLVALLTLALGIGANTAIFSVVNAVLFRSLPFPEAERLIFVGQSFRGVGPAGSGEPKFLFWHEQAQSFEAMACYSGYGGARGNLSGGNEAEYVRGLRVSQEFFRVFGVAPALGRAFTKAEDTPGGERVAILSDGLWQRRFGGRRDLIGQTLLFNDQPATVVGIMPAGFRFGSGVDLFVPMQARAGANVDPNAEVVGRLKPGSTLEQARAELQLIAENFRAGHPNEMHEGESIAARPYQEMFTAPLKPYLWMLMAAVGLLLLIACANVANLQLVRASARQREIAVRLALGAGNGRIVRQLVTEGLLLALVGGTMGALLAFWGTGLLVTALPEGLLPGQLIEIKMDWRVLLFAFGAAAGTGLLFGLAPAWQARQVDVNSALKEGSNKGSSPRNRLRGALVITEVALSLVLLVGAGLLTRTFANLIGVEPGFDPHNVLTFQTVLDGPRYNTTQKSAAFYRDALERIRSLPGVESAAVINKLPLDWQFNMPVSFSDQPDNIESVQVRMVSPDYFRVMKIPLTQGRAFTDNDNDASQSVAIVNEAFVRKFFDGQNPFARQLTIGRKTNDQARQIVGIAADVKQMGLDSPALPTVFAPIPQFPDKLMAVVRTFTPAYFTIRTSAAPRSAVEAIKRELAAIDPTLAMSRISSMEEIAANSIAQERFNMLLVGLFACLGLLLASVGIYGVVSYSVAQRTNELGIRIALGAQSADVIKLILRQGLGLALAGVALGTTVSIGLTRWIKSFLFGVGPNDPWTFVAVALLLTVIALLACWIPARRATKVDPLRALRHE